MYVCYYMQQMYADVADINMCMHTFCIRFTQRSCVLSFVYSSMHTHTSLLFCFTKYINEPRTFHIQMFLQTTRLLFLQIILKIIIINRDCMWISAQLRVDGVLMRMRDTRFFCALKDWPQKSPQVIRERSWREATFAELAAVSFR